MSRQKIGLLGGSFNPVTKGHIDLAQFVLSKTDLDEVWLLPCYNHHLKDSLVESFHRMEMCRLACHGLSKIKVSSYEIDRRLDGSVFSLLNRLSDDPKMSEYEFSFIIGTDNIVIFDQWKNYDALKIMARFITVPRQGVIVPKNISWYKNAPHIYLDQQDPIIEVSSTEIRKRLSGWWNGGLSIDEVEELNDKINPSVLQYIQKYNLYKVEHDISMEQARVSEVDG